jgi:hypothetical protein
MRWERLHPLAGVVAVVLFVVGIILAEADRPDDDTPENLLAWFQADADMILAGEVVFVIGVPFLIWFFGSLRVAFMAAEGATAHLTAIAYGSGLLASLSLLLQAAPMAQGALDEGDLSAESAQTLVLLNSAFFGAVEFSLVPMFVAAGLLALRTRVLPIWLGWVSLAIAVLLLIIPIGWAGVVWAFPLWTLIVSVLLYLRAAPAPGAAAVP